MLSCVKYSMLLMSGIVFVVHPLLDVFIHPEGRNDKTAKNKKLILKMQCNNNNNNTCNNNNNTQLSNKIRTMCYNT